MKTSRRASVGFALAALLGLMSEAACVSDASLADAKCASVCAGICVDIKTDDSHCGACDVACGANAKCQAGVCQAVIAPGTDGGVCPSGSTACSGSCALTNVDPGNCGSCGHACATNQTCANGLCACPPSLLDFCGSTCTNIQADVVNCGACGKTCASGLACVSGACVATTAPPLALSVLAGALGSAGNLDGKGTASRLNGPHAVCVDSGAAYVFGTNDCTVRHVDLTTFATTTVAGVSGACALTDGVGASARLFTPRACAGDGAGTIYFVDAGSCAVRALDTMTFAVHTVAGGTACGTTFSSPQGIAYDKADGYLFIADAATSSIKRVVLTTGAVSVLAGSTTGLAGTDDGKLTSARFSGPTALSFDSVAGVLYVADTNNDSLRTIGLAKAMVATVAGSPGQPGYLDGVGRAALLNAPSGLAADGAGKLYVTEDLNHDVRAVSLTDFTVSTVVGAPTVAGYADGRGTGALFTNPRGIAYDGVGTLYVADFGNHALRAVDLGTLTATTRAGLGAARGSANGIGTTATFDFPWSVAYDGNGTLFVSDYVNSVIRTVNTTTGAVDTLAGTPGAIGNVDGVGTATRWSGPSALAFDGASTLYVADRSNHTIRQVSTTTKVVTTIAGAPGNAGYADGATPLFNGPLALALGTGADANTLFIADASRTVRALDLTTHATTVLAGSAADPLAHTVDGTADAARFALVVSLAYRNGVVYVADANRLRAINVLTKAVTTLSGPPGYADGVGGYTSFDFAGPTPTSYGQLSIDTDGTLLIADFDNGVVRRFDPTTLAATTLAGVRGRFGAVPGTLPTSLPTSPRSIVAIKNGYAFAANEGIFVLR